MTPAQFKKIRLSLDLNVAQMAQALRLKADKTIRRIEWGETEITGPVSLLMELYRDRTIKPPTN